MSASSFLRKVGSGRLALVAFLLNLPNLVFTIAIFYGLGQRDLPPGPPKNCGKSFTHTLLSLKVLFSKAAF